MLRLDPYHTTAFGMQKNTASAKKQVEQSIHSYSSFQGLAKPDISHLKANFISFLGDKCQNLDTTPVNDVINEFNEGAKTVWDRTLKIADAYQTPELTSLHYLKSALHEAENVLDGRREDKEGYLSSLLNAGKNKLSGLSDDKDTKNLLKVRIAEFIKDLDEHIKASGKDTIKGTTKVSDEFIQTLNDANLESSDSEDGKTVVSNELLLKTIAKSRDSAANQLFTQFLEELEVIADIKNADEKATKIAENSNIIAANSPIIDLNQALKNTNVFKLDYYDQKAKLLANLISANKNATLVYTKGAYPELIASSLMKMLRENKIKDLNLYNTKVIKFNTSKLIEAKRDTGASFANLPLGNNNANTFINFLKEARDASRKDGNHRVIFIQDFHLFMHLLDGPSTLFNANVLGDKVHIVGLVQDNVYQQMIHSPQEHAAELQWQNAFETIQINALSPQKTKELMKKDMSLLKLITKNYPGKITISKNAMDSVVDIATTSRGGALPGKAYDLLKLVIAAKCNSNGINDVRITEKDVKEYFNKYPELRQAPTSQSGKFSVVYDTGVRLTDVGGAAQAKDVVMELLDFIKKPEKFEKTGAKMPKGILLSGSPGNGKTHLARAIAGEAGVPFVSVSGSEFVEMYVGVGAARVRELFNFAREQARSSDSKTAIIFFDEFETLGRKRSSASASGGQQEAEQTLNQLLSEMDGLNSNNSDVRVVVLAATNRPDLLDEAVTRPGRFDYKVPVPNPSDDLDARYEILSIHTKNKKIAGDREKVLRDVASRTAGASGATLADIVNKAAIITAKDNREALSINDFVEAKLESIAGRIDRTKRPQWYREIVVAHECGHALVRLIMLMLAKEDEDKPWSQPREIDLITTDARGDFGGAVFNRPGENVMTTFESTFAELASCFAGYSVEKNRYGIRGSWGISSDLKNATGMAKHAVTQMGMGPNTGIISSAEDDKVSEMMGKEIKKDVKLLVDQSSKVSDKIVIFFKDFIDQYVNEFKANAGKGGNNLSGEEFMKKFNAWLESSGKKKEFENLKNDIKKIIEATKSGKIDNKE